MNTKRWMAIIIFAVLCVTYFNTNSLRLVQDSGASNLMDSWLSGGSGQVVTGYYQVGTGEDLALIHLEGTILDTGDYYAGGYYHSGLLEAFKQAYEDPAVKGIVLSVDSPGGGVYECDEVYRKIKELQEQYPKPMVVSMGNLAASAAYYISMTADELYANRMSLTGSIGVISSYMNIGQLAENLGISMDVYKSGEVKDMNSGWRPATEQERAINEGLINEYFAYFVDVVAEGRGMERGRVLELADGRVYTASQALDNGLIDAIGDLDEAIARAAELAGIDDPSVQEYGYNSNIWNYFGFTGDWKSQRLQDYLLEAMSYPRPLYLYSQGAI